MAKKKAEPKKRAVGKKPAVKTRIAERGFPVIIEKQILPEEKIAEGPSESALPDEEIAFRLAKLYFEQIARTGFKRSLGLDELINAYLYSLARVNRKEFELREIGGAVKRSKIERGEF